MKPTRKAAVVAVTGTALGAVGLGVLAMPAGADDTPTLPDVGAQELVASVLQAEPQALAGTVELHNDLGLASMPGVPALNAESARVYHDGEGRSRLALQQDDSELTVVRHDRTVWTFDSAENTATKTTIPAERARHGEDDRTSREQLSDPTAAASQLVDLMRKSSTVKVDGTARVADRAAYELVLTPKPSERTLLREIRVAVDSETRMPLRVAVMANGTTTPALEFGFSDLEFGDQPDDLFAFTPPPGAEVTENKPEAGKPEGAKDAEKQRRELAALSGTKVVGDGWDTLVTGTLPKELLAEGRRAPEGRAGGTEGGGVESPAGMLRQLGERVTGEFGSGYVVSTKVGTALVADDGRFAAGAVPQEVLVQALETR